MKITIEKVENGFIVFNQDIINSDVKHVFEDNDTDLKHVQLMLYQVLEDFNILGSKHDKERIRIMI